tara:strand:+ start:33 stop:215 length:183 start_codon:yes stop_codon:yes gene_type:complete
MKVGDLVKFDTHLYPKLDGKLGVLRGHRDGNRNQWEVFIDGRIHPYFLCVEDLEVVSESR